MAFSGANGNRIGDRVIAGVAKMRAMRITIDARPVDKQALNLVNRLITYLQFVKTANKRGGMQTKKRSKTRIVAVGSIMLIAGTAHAQEYPNRIIKIITAAAGGGSDFIARIVAQGISAPLGQQIIIDNKGTGVLAGEAAVKAPPDGYTLTVQGGAFWIGPLLRKTAYDPVKDFLPISLVVREVNILAVHPSVPAQSVSELIAYAKANPGKLNYSSPGVGSTTHLASELLKAMAGVTSNSSRQTKQITQSPNHPITQSLNHPIPR